MCRDIQAKLKNRPAELQWWNQLVRNELCKALDIPFASK